MKLQNSILKDVRESLSLSAEDTSFDAELKMHINACISKLNQNGVGNIITVTDELSTWEDLMDATKVEGNKYFQLVPLYIMLSTKVIFDPPPPSTVEYYTNNVNEILWRLKNAYEEPYVSRGGELIE